MNILIVPDSFKGTMTSIEVCDIMTATLKECFPLANIAAIPVADGGEGSVDAFLAASPGRRVEVCVSGPYYESLASFYALLDHDLAVVEMAAAAGLPLVGNNRHADKTTTFGVGQLILDAAKHGAGEIIVGLGGSCTNDGGCGAAAACGVRFFDDEGHSFVPVGGTLARIAHIDLSHKDPLLAKVKFTTMCDIDNPLCGPLGASAVFAPQKGATPRDVVVLDAGLAHLAQVIKTDLGIDVLNLSGAGAAGGMGAGMVAFFGSSLRMGIQTVLDVANFDQRAAMADLVFSGEGSFDSQSLRGKVVVGVAERCKRIGVPLIVVAGAVDATVIPSAVRAGVSHVCSVNRKGILREVALRHPRANLAYTMGLLSELLMHVPEPEIPHHIHLHHFA